MRALAGQSCDFEERQFVALQSQKPWLTSQGRGSRGPSVTATTNPRDWIQARTPCESGGGGRAGAKENGHEEVGPHATAEQLETLKR